MELTLPAFGIVLAVGSAVFAAVAVGRGGGAAVTAGFALGALVFGPARLPDPVWTGVPAAAVAVLHLFRPQVRLLTAACGGAMAAAWATVLQAQGAPWFAAAPLAAAVPAVSVLLAARRPGFAPPDVVDEAVLIVCGLCLVMAAAPAVLAGWHAAAALAAERAGAAMTVPPWLLLLGGGSAAAGGAYSLWRRR